jgi:diguanylate cyclase (GGDEF)-like protein
MAVREGPEGKGRQAEDEAVSPSTPWWYIDYAVEPTPTQAAVATTVIGIGWVGCMVPLLVALVLARGDSPRWGLIGAGVALLVLQAALLLVDLRGLMAGEYGHDSRAAQREAAVGGATGRTESPEGSEDRFRPPKPLRSVAQMLTMIVGIALIGYGLTGVGGFYWPLLFLPVSIAAVIGNRAMVGVALGAAACALIGTLVADEMTAVSVVVVTVAFVSVTSAWAIMVQEIRDAGIRAATRFDLQSQVTDVILSMREHKQGLEEGLPHILPLAAAELAAERISAYVCGGEEEPRALAGFPAGHDEVVDLAWQPPPGFERNGYEIESDLTHVWARSDTERALVLVAHRPPPDLRWRVSINASLGHLAKQLELLLGFTAFFEELEDLSKTDTLTGLPNRLDLMDRIAREYRVAKRRQEPLVLCMIDIDLFKSYNDTFGHVEGDKALADLGSLFEARTRGSDFMCRYGGEEFCLVMPNTYASGAVVLVDELRTLAGALHTRRELSFSAGVAEWDGEESVDALLRKADAALYQAKAGGRHQTVVARSDSDSDRGRCV